MNISLGITGTQKGSSLRQRLAFTRLVDVIAPTELRHGCCVGVDEELHNLFVGLLPRSDVQVYPSNIVNKRGKLIGGLITWHPEQPPLVRNKHVVEGSQVVVGFPVQETGEKVRSGTWSTIRYARSLEIPTVVVRPSGLAEANDASAAAEIAWLLNVKIGNWDEA